MRNKKKIFILYLIWRIALFIFAFIGGKFLPFSPRFPYSEVLLISSGLPSFVWSFANFDGVHYLTIAKSGYSANFTQVFFPLFPVLLGLLSKILLFIHPIVIGTFLSSIFFLFSLFLFKKLLSLDYDKSIVFSSILFLMLFPTSFYFAALYTESIFLFLVLLFFYFSRKGRWVHAGLIGLLASATRLNGVLLLPTILVEIWQQDKKSKTFGQKFWTIVKNPSIYIIPIGLILYILYLNYYYHDPLYFWHVQPIFGASRSGNSIILLPQVIYRYLKIFISAQTTESLFTASLEFISTLSGIGVLIYGFFKKIRLSYLIFSLLTLLLPTLTGTFSSMPRYILLAFPLYIMIGMLKRRWLKIAIMILFLTLLSLLTILFTRGHWVA